MTEQEKPYVKIEDVGDGKLKISSNLPGYAWQGMVLAAAQQLIGSRR